VADIFNERHADGEFMDASSWTGKTGGRQGASVMSFGASFRLGPFTVDSEGRLSPGEPAGTPAFLFRWRNRVVRAKLAQGDPPSGRLALQSTLGRVPSTAATPNGTLRPRSFVLLHWIPRSVPPGWRVRLLADHRVWLETETRIAMPLTAAALITEITEFLLALSPYLDLLEEEGLAAPSSTGVTVAG
jgi:hypothetical protein